MRLLFCTCVLLALAACGGDGGGSAVDRAREHIASADYDAATVELQNALQEPELAAEAHWLLSTVLLRQGDARLAENQLRSALRQGWSADAIMPVLAKTLMVQGKTDEALALEYEKLSAPAAAQLLAAQAIAVMADRKKNRSGEANPEAQVLLASARGYAPEELAVQLAESTLLVREAQLDEAWAKMQGIVKEWPEDAGVRWLEGQILLLQGNTPAAREAIDKSIELAPTTNLTDHIMRALVSIELGDYESALADVELVLMHRDDDPTANYIAGVSKFHNGEYRDAITTLTRAQRVQSHFPLVLYYLASAYLVERDLDLAERFAREFNAIELDNINGANLLGAVLLHKNRAEEAMTILQPVLDRSPGNVLALNYMANAKLMVGETDLGMMLYAQIGQLVPSFEIHPLPQVGVFGWDDESHESDMLGSTYISGDFPQADLLNILNHLARKDHEGAVDAAVSYQGRDPGNVAALNVLGRTYFAAGRNTEARAAFERALYRDPGNTSANWSLAELALADDDTSAARAFYESGLEKHPDDLTTLIKLAELEALLGDDYARLRWLRQAARSNPAFLSPRLELAQHYIGTDSPESIPPLFEKLHPLQAASPRVLELLALAQLRLGESDAAAESLDKWIHEDPGSAQAYYLRALTANAQGDQATLRASLSKAIARDPEHVLALISLARLARSDADEERFGEYLATLVDIAPETPEVLKLRSLKAHDAAEYDEAVRLATRVYALAPSTQSVLDLASLQRAAGDPGNAHLTLRQWIARNPKDVDARLYLANELSQAGRTQAAKNQFLAVLEIQPDNATVLNNLAWTLRKENPSEALQYGHMALALAPDSPQVLDTVAVIEHLGGEHAKARERLRLAMQVAPGSPTLLYHDAMISVALGQTEQAIAALELLLGQGGAQFPERAEAQALLDNLRG